MARLESLATACPVRDELCKVAGVAEAAVAVGSSRALLCGASDGTVVLGCTARRTADHAEEIHG